MKRILVLFAILMLMLAGQLAHAVYLDSSWYAKVTNVQSGLAGGISTNSAHIQVTEYHGGPSFTVTQPGEAANNERASWGNTTLADWNRIGPISFDYETYWTQPNLILELWTNYMNPFDPPARVWWSSGTDLRSGHVYVNANPNGYTFKLVVVPEPSSIVALSSLLAGGMARIIISRRRNRGEQ